MIISGGDNPKYIRYNFEVPTVRKFPAYKIYRFQKIRHSRDT